MSKQPYTTMQTVPAYIAPVWVAGKLTNADAGLKWGGKEGPPPAIGETIICTINNLGPAVVTGYFTLDGWLGVLCKLNDPPAWYLKQNGGNVVGGIFGPEFKMMVADEVAQQFTKAPAA